MAIQVSPKRYDVDMTTGSVVRHLLSFSLPYLLGSLFQQFYNLVDTWVVGNYVSSAAFSAVGTTSPVIFMLIGFFNGLAGGINIVISQYYGAKKYDSVKRAVHTAVLMILLICALFTVVGICMTPAMLHLMNTPAEVLDQAADYLRIYFAGVSGLILYNTFAGILRATGNTCQPLYALIVAAVLNVGLDLLLVLKFRMGIRGVAYATIVSQAVSALVLLVLLLRTASCVRLQSSALHLDREMLGKILKIGLPSALQISLTSFSNVFVQAYINGLGTYVMAGWTIFIKAESVFLLPIQSVVLSLSTFTGQNLGVGNVARIRQGRRIALGLLLACIGVLIVVVCAFAPQIVAFFNKDPDVISAGAVYLRWICPFYLVHSIGQIHIAVLQGAGNTKLTMGVLLSSYVVTRQIYLYLVANFISYTAVPVALGYPAGWIMAALLATFFYCRTDLTKTRLTS